MSMPELFYSLNTQVNALMIALSRALGQSAPLQPNTHSLMEPMQHCWKLLRQADKPAAGRKYSECVEPWGLTRATSRPGSSMSDTPLSAGALGRLGYT